MKKVIVVGAGAAGLAAAVRLQHAGYAVDLYEKNADVGGKMYKIEGDGFVFDVGPTIVMMPDIYEEVFTQCGKKASDYIPMQKVEPMLTLAFSEGAPFSFSSDLVKLTKVLEEISEEDTQGWFSYLASIYKRYLVAKNHFIMRSFRGPGSFYNPKSLVNALRLKTFDDAYSSISKYVKDERLRKALAFQTLYIGISPYEGPSLYTIIPMIELIYGVWFIKGGMHAMARGMRRLFEEMGGRVHLNAPVEEIVVQGGRATGIVSGGNTIPADYVVCGADFPYAVKNLVPGQNRGKYTDKKIDKMQYSCSCFVLYLGLDKKYPVNGLHTIRFAKDFSKNVDDIFKEGIFPQDPSFYIYTPSEMDASLAPEGCQGVYVLVPVPPLDTGKARWDDDAVDAYKAKVLALMEKETVFSDISRHIRWQAHYTPLDFEQKFNAYNGATFGLRPTLRQSNYWRPHNKFPYCENLYFCGSSTHPGAGVPIVLTSAKLAAEELMRDDR